MPKGLREMVVSWQLLVAVTGLPPKQTTDSWNRTILHLVHLGNSRYYYSCGGTLRSAMYLWLIHTQQQRAVLVSSGSGGYISLPFLMLQGGSLPLSMLSLWNCTVQNTPSASNVTHPIHPTPPLTCSAGAKKTIETCPVGQIIDSGNMPGHSLTIRLKISRVCGAGSYHTAVWEPFFHVNYSYNLSHTDLRSFALLGTSRNQTIFTARQAKPGRPPSRSAPLTLHLTHLTSLSHACIPASPEGRRLRTINQPAHVG